MNNKEFIPEVFDQFPEQILSLKFEGRLVDPGTILQPKEVKDIPCFIEWVTEPNVLYTVCMIDPDVPCRKDHRFREFLHWLVVNVPSIDFKKGKSIVEYVGPCPLKDSGYHRIIILVYKQKEIIKYEEAEISSRSAVGRARFSNKAFARKYKLGPLVAANMFITQYDDYVPKIHRQMHFCPKSK